jgi:CHAT domain-containing protein
MEGGETHAYLLPLDAGQYAGVFVFQRGIDVAVTARDPDGRLLASVDSPSPQAAWVAEPIPLITRVAGTYRVEVRPAEPDAAPGAYAFRIDALRPATPRDHTLVRAERLLSQRGAARAREAAQLFQQIAEPSREADALYTLGSALYELDDNSGARKPYERALQLFREVGRERDAIRTLNALGRTWRQEPERALEVYREALELNRRIGDRRQQATALHNLGKIYDQLGETEKALDHYDRARPIWQELGARSDQAATLLALGDLYQRMGETRKALDLLPQAFFLFKAEGSRAYAADTLRVLGDAHARAGRPEDALVFENRALEIQREINNLREQANALNSIGCCHLLLSQPGKARGALAEAQAIYRRLGDRTAEAIALANLGLADEQLDRPQQAIPAFEKALPVLVSAGYRDHEALALYGLARARRRLGELTAARQLAEQAIGLVESLRGESASLGMRASFLASKQDYYGFYVDLLMDLNDREPGAGYDALALAASEQARARSLLDLLAESGADLRKGVDPGLLAREADLVRRINAADARRRRAPSTAATAADTALRELLTQQDRVEAAIRRTSPGYASLALPRPLTLREIKSEVVDGGTVFLQYALGRERSFLWTVTPDSLTPFVLPPGREIEEAAREVHGLLSSRPRTLAGDRTKRALAELSDLLLGQAAGLLEGKRLVVVPDGALHYVPFAALPAPGTDEPLVVRHEVVILPSASSLAAIRREARAPASGTLAVVAPELDAGPDPIRTAAVRDGMLERIPYSREEAEALLALSPPGKSLGILGSEASREAVLSGRLAPYRLIHFATHGILDEDDPALSRLLLSQGSLYAHEVYHLRLSADLVVLSACRTGLGQEIRGEGLVGLTRGFLHAGARGVVVSLWDVDDLATAELMRRFYRGMLREGLPPAAALRAAQASLRHEPGWKEPYFWAGFMLQGEWQPGR